MTCWTVEEVALGLDAMARERDGWAAGSDRADDGDVARAFRRDAHDLRVIARTLRQGRVQQGKDAILELGTFVRETLPDQVWAFAESPS